MNNLEIKKRFADRHIGPTELEIKEMVSEIGYNSLDELIEKTIPQQIRITDELELEDSISEYKFIEELKTLSSKNKVFKSYIGMGYYPTIVPAVIQRNILENPGWYTQYTPYQAEISQGRLEALVNFQTMIVDLTGLPLANASLLDEATAAAEAMSMFYALRKGNKKDANVFFVSEDIFPQTLDVLKTRAYPLGIEIRVGDHHDIELNDDIFGILVQYPAASGEIYNYEELFKSAENKNIYKAVAADIMSLALLKAPGEFGADCVVGNTQRFGVPMGFGGPHAAYFATKEEFKRQIPGRIIGVSIDSHGNNAYRMALQTREQHIKRERATSNICTAQVLLAIMAGMYAVYHGPKGIKNIAERINNLANVLNSGLKSLGFRQLNENYFDTLRVKVESDDILQKIKEKALAKEINFNYFFKGEIGISVSEITELEDVENIFNIFSEAKGSDKIDLNNHLNISKTSFPEELNRESDYLTHPVFNSFHSETEMLRYMKRLERKDLSLTTSMIPLGSCTMKLNATTEMLGISWNEFASVHPFVPKDQAEGYYELFEKLEDQLKRITGFAGVSLQPNSGAQGEYAGLMVIKEYQKKNGEGHRNIVLIPSSAHGTNPASAVMAGNKVVIVKVDENGYIELEDLKTKADQHKENLSALMITYPSTAGVFEEEVKEICEAVHQNGGMVYMDGANMNAQVGLTNPKEIGADVVHLNLHKTFTIPHGGGGPGMGPIAVADHLVDYLPSHPVINIGTGKSMSAVSAAPWGSASILIISYAYIKMMGSEGLKKATEIAILNANYIKRKLEKYYPVLYSGKNDTNAHELIFDTREFKNSANIEVEDIAKRLMDYGYHAPTVSFPVAGTLMVEPTESESKIELDRFCDAMISIRNEIKEIENGSADKEDNVLKNAPHTAFDVISDDWNHKYSRTKAAYPVEWIRDNKFWVSVGRVNNAYGDRNLVCSCLPVDQYEEETV